MPSVGERWREAASSDHRLHLSLRYHRHFPQSRSCVLPCLRWSPAATTRSRPFRSTIESGRISRIDAATDNPTLPFVAPGLVDLQINGFGGIEFNDRELTIEKVRQVALSQDQFGVTTFLATCTTDGHDVLKHALGTIAKAIRESPEVAARIPGIHLEGPFIWPDDGPRGAHPKQHVRPPDWDEFRRLQDAADGRIKLHDVSPEYENSPDFIRRAADQRRRSSPSATPKRPAIRSKPPSMRALE